MLKPTHTNPTLNIIVSLSCEAKPLVDYYRLKKQAVTGFSCFTGKLNNHLLFDINLLVSGVGATNMAAACGWLAARCNNNCAWLNIGIAGSNNHAFGEIIRIICSSPAGKGKHLYPSLVSKWSGANSALISYPEVCLDYPDNAAVDMEGNAFFTVSSKFSSSELVQSLKIISDNPINSLEALNSDKISKLLSAKLDQINSFIKNLVSLIPMQLNLPDELTEWHHLHTTVSQLHQYRELSQMLINIDVDHFVLKDKLQSANSMKELIADFKSILQQSAPSLSMSDNT